MTSKQRRDAAIVLGMALDAAREDGEIQIGKPSLLDRTLDWIIARPQYARILASGIVGSLPESGLPSLEEALEFVRWPEAERQEMLSAESRLEANRAHWLCTNCNHPYGDHDGWSFGKAPRRQWTPIWGGPCSNELDFHHTCSCPKYMEP